MLSEQCVSKMAERTSIDDVHKERFRTHSKKLVNCMTGRSNKVLVVIGLFLVWIPVISPVFFSIIALIERGRFLFDFLMPAELFLVFLPGAILLLLVAIRTKNYVKQICFGLFSAIALLFGGQAIAEITGLASGERKFRGWLAVLVTAMIILYSFAIVEVGLSGFYLLRKLTSNTHEDTSINK